MPTVHVRQAHSPIVNMQQFESRAGTMFGDSGGLIPLGFVQPRNPQTLTLNEVVCSAPQTQTHSLNLLRIEPKLMPAVHVRHTLSPIRNMQLFESRAGTKKASHFCEAFFVIPLGFEPRTHTLKVYCSTS